MNRQWKLFSLFTLLTGFVLVWLFYELGVFTPSVASAQGEAVSSAPALPPSDDALKARIKTLEKKEAEVARREAAMQEKELVLNSQVERYEKAIREMKSRIAELEPLKAKQADGLRQMYERMEPKKASQILDGMDVATASQILSGMRGEKAAEILSRMSAEKARGITEKILGKRSIASQNKVNEVQTKDDSSASP